jgi:5'-phosphate synthase pdxT subunit
MYDPLRQLLGSGIPVLATCGGLILLADEVIEPPQKCMRLLPVAVVRNGYGRQIHSGTFQLDSGFFPPGTSGVFIRAPRIVRVGDAEVLARWQGDPVLVRKGPILGSCFHPELERGHPLTRHFADLVRGKLPNPTVT